MVQRQWDKWAWIPALIVMVLAIARMAWGREPFCGGADENCLREWVSALSGWGAVAAAIPTVAYLAKQLRDTERYHREGLRFELRQSRALAVRTERLITRCRFHCDGLKRKIDDPRIFSSAVDVSRAFEELLRYLSSRDFVLFESEFSPPDTDDIENLIGQLQLCSAEIATSLLNLTEDALAFEIPENTRRFLNLNVHFVESYLDDCQAIVDETKAEYERVTGVLVETE